MSITMVSVAELRALQMVERRLGWSLTNDPDDSRYKMAEAC